MSLIKLSEFVEIDNVGKGDYSLYYQDRFIEKLTADEVLNMMQLFNDDGEPVTFGIMEE